MLLSPAAVVQLLGKRAIEERELPPREVGGLEEGGARGPRSKDVDGLNTYQIRRQVMSTVFSFRMSACPSGRSGWLGNYIAVSRLPYSKEYDRSLGGTR